MKIGKVKKVVQRPDAIPVILPKKKPADKPIPVGIPVKDWPAKKPEPAEKE